MSVRLIFKLFIGMTYFSVAGALCFVPDEIKIPASRVGLILAPISLIVFIGALMEIVEEDK